MIDGNTYALNKYLDEQDKNEKAEENYMESIDDKLTEIGDLIEDLQQGSGDYREILNEALRDLI